MSSPETHPTDRCPTRLLFVLEQSLGHRVHGANLLRMAADHGEFVADHVAISHDPERSANRLPVLGSWSFEASRAARAALRSALRTRRPDAVYIHSQVAALFAVDVMREVPTVVSLDATPRNYDSLGVSYDHETQAAPVERLKLALNRRALRAAAAVVGFSHWAADSVVHDYGVAPGKVQVIPSGVDLDRFAPDGRRQAEGPLRVLFVGGDFERKGGADLLAAFARLGGTAELDIVTGTPPASPPVGADVRVHVGLQPDSPELTDLYRRAHVFAFPSRGDCSPRVVAEAMASGLPVVACEVGGIAEMVTDGVTGLLVPVGAPERLAGAITRLERGPDERRRMGLAALAAARSDHDARRNAERVFELLLAQVPAPGRRSDRPELVR